MNDLADQNYREKIKNDLDTNFLVEAGAGSGKTTSLIDRMLNLVKTSKCSVDEIAAITYTRKAAAELRERFQEVLEKEYHKLKTKSKVTKSPIEIKNLKQTLQDIDNIFIGTVHSFCGRLLRERPVEAGIDPDFQEIDGEDEKKLLTEAWNNYLVKLKLKKPQLIEKLSELRINVTELKSSFQKLSRFRDVEIISKEMEEPELKLKLAAKKMIEFSQEVAKNIPEKEPEKGYDKLMQAVRTTLFLANKLDELDNHTQLKILTLYEKNVDVKVTYWGDNKPIAKEYKDYKLPFLKENYVEPALTAWREYCHFYIVEFLKPAVNYYQKVKKKKAEQIFKNF